MPIPSYDKLPEYMQHSARMWIEDGILTGDFLAAIVTNDLKGAARAADSTNLPLLHIYATWMINDIPAECHGSIEKVRAWTERGGLNGN